MKKIYYIILSIIILIVSCSKMDDTTVVQINEQKLNKDVVFKRFKRTQEFRNSTSFTSEMIKTYIEKNLIDQLLFLAEAYDQDFDEDTTLNVKFEKIKKQILTKRNGLLYKYLTKDEVFVTDDEVKQFYDNSGFQIKVAHILVSDKDLADSLYNIITNGADFGELAKDHSLDLRSANTNGEISRFFTRGSLNKKFEDVAFELKKNEVSKPLQTSYGYHIIKLLDSRAIARKPFDKTKDQMSKKITQLKTMEIINNYITALPEKYNIIIDEEKSKMVIDAYKSTNKKSPTQIIPKKHFSQAELNSVIVTYKGGQWTINKLIEMFNMQKRNSQLSLKRTGDIVNLVNRAILFDLMFLEAIELNLDKDDIFLTEFKTAKDQIVEREYIQKMVNDKVVVSDEDLKLYYDKNKDKYNNKSFESSKVAINRIVKNAKEEVIFSQLHLNLMEKFNIKYNDIALKDIVDRLNNLKEKSKKVEPPKPPKPPKQDNK